MQELARAYREGRPPHELLRQKWQEWVDSLRGVGSSGSPSDTAGPSAEESLDWSRFAWGS